MNSVIFYGAKEEFETLLPENYRTLTDLAAELDVNKHYLQVPGYESNEPTKVKVEHFVAWSQEYAGVKEHVILNFVQFLSKMEIGSIYLHNPPLQISEQITRVYPSTKIQHQKYSTITEETIKEINHNFENNVFGQKQVKIELMKALFPLTLNKREKPVVIMFYGSSGVGKTETAYFIGKCLNQKIFRKQLSMFQNNQSATYLFGGAHYENSFAKDLLDRSSNVILLDEFDKALYYFHSAFYQLFDEGIFVDQNYYVKLKKSIIICTSNYHSIEEIKKELGDAIFNRFDAIIGFDELCDKAKEEIALKYIEEKRKEYNDEKNMIISNEMLKKLVRYSLRCSNARQIQHLVEDTYSLYYIMNNLIKE